MNGRAVHLNQVPPERFGQEPRRAGAYGPYRKAVRTEWAQGR